MARSIRASTRPGGGDETGTGVSRFARQRGGRAPYVAFGGRRGFGPLAVSRRSSGDRRRTARRAPHRPDSAARHRPAPPPRRPPAPAAGPPPPPPPPPP